MEECTSIDIPFRGWDVLTMPLGVGFPGGKSNSYTGRSLWAAETGIARRLGQQHP